MQTKLLLQGAYRLLPVGLIVIIFGMAWGVAAKEAGLADSLTYLMSALVFAGASQFASLELWSGQMNFFALFLITFAVNARHILMGSVVYLDIKDKPWWQQMWLMLLVTDAPFAMMQAEPDQSKRIALLLGGGWLLWFMWMIGTAAGVVFGNLIGTPYALGLDALMPIFFSVLVAAIYKDKSNIIPFIGAGLAALLWYLSFSGSWHVIVGAVVGGLLSISKDAE